MKARREEAKGGRLLDKGGMWGAQAWRRHRVGFAPGSYTVIGAISDPNYYGSATNTLVIGLPPQNLSASTTSSQNGSQLTLFLNGTPGYPYSLQTATNLTPLLTWQSVLTNPADSSGNWSLILSNLNTWPGVFYRAVGQ